VRRWKTLGLVIAVLTLVVGGVVVLRITGTLPTGAVVMKGLGAPIWDPADPLVVATWNVHYGAGPTLERGAVSTRDEVIANLDAIAKWIRDSNVDIVALQEVDRAGNRGRDIDELEYLRQATGLDHVAWTATWDMPYVPWPGLDPRVHIGRVRSGQAVLSRYPLSKPKRHPLVQPAKNGWLWNAFYLHRALLEVTADLGDGRELRIFNAHFEAFDVPNKELHADATKALLKAEGPWVILLGDMNAVPPEAVSRKSFLDEPATDFTTDTTIDTLRSIGLREVVPPEVYAASEAPWFTFPASAPNRRLDYIFYGSALDVRTVAVPRMDAPASDHLPVLASFGAGAMR
jgi:endonuclease/exonuclease/phosphatase family metal-dependent hydrolase